ncbi:CD209 antigen-like protein 2 [Anarrhichthys ocellatus]|uniref:CD209 antigen-like protein 2 n=1 Tax=Anarrhichthys ocellatus TaxID=433405 RepID=UPI0012ED94AC|nr:CD209 antigen-like protein 2 [Anarrhichthys ocellatus]
MNIVVADISFNHSELQSSYQTPSENHSQLQEEVKQLEGKIEKKWCPEGWRRFGCSCYFKSNKRNTWHGSRDDCQQKAADLVVINNKEEHKFVLELNMDKDSWISQEGNMESNKLEMGMGMGGQITADRHVRHFEGSRFHQMFWATGLPHDDRNNVAATCCNQQGQWTESNSYVYKSWICEKWISWTL